MNRSITIFILLLLHAYKLPASEFRADDAPPGLSRAELVKELESLFNGEDARGILWGVNIFNLNNNDRIFSLNEAKPFRPASNLKVVIAAAALKALGTTYKYETKLFIDGKIKNGTLDGNIVVMGSGDPTFHMNHFDKWREALRKYNIGTINGDIIGVDTIFDDQKIGILWSWDDLSNCYSAQVSGLQINNNCLRVSVEPGIKTGFPAKISKTPNTSYVTIYNNTKTSTEPTSLAFKRESKTNNIMIKGNIQNQSDNIVKWVSVDNPTMYFLNLFHANLVNNGFKIKGKIADARDIGYTIDRNRLYQIESIESVSIREIINDFLKHSINLYGESILKTLGFIYFNEGTTYNGRLAINLILKEYNLPEGILFIADGSGLSNLNLISPEYMTSLLKSVSGSSYYQVFFDALSVSGMSGTLRKRLTSQYLKGSVHAKTGYIRNVRTLSGYIDTFGNDRLAFAIFANNYGPHMSRAELVINQACRLMRRFNDNNNRTGE
ncbi:MAG: D-alanyl-D-alanine carboxypeptidase/D-alanyl-D-alanine-endopeptidase [Oligoflexia bacterium]|nr:D-alanyl-D-alanine carboxypeptidase/D-alanyl-D-alanine-endopeptidase [Oligoflexia bacterium]